MSRSLAQAARLFPQPCEALAEPGVTPGIWVPSCLSLLERLEQTCFVGVPMGIEDHDEKVARSPCARCVGLDGKSQVVNVSVGSFVCKAAFVFYFGCVDHPVDDRVAQYLWQGFAGFPRAGHYACALDVGSAYWHDVRQLPDGMLLRY